jgi:DHA1 family bicyclomycin/chloramphenicol resistance-like MFS transporter
MEPEHTQASSTEKRQKYLGDKLLIVLIAFLSAFIPLSIDLYLPALPGMAAFFNVPVGLVNLTLILFFIFFAVFTLLWGPLSDKYGRRPILLVGLVLYIAGSILCALAHTIYQLIGFRILQAVGSSAATAVATALVKDLWSGRKRESVLAVVQAMVIIAPIIAPICGAVLLQFTSWRGAFWTLAALGAIALLFSLLLEETISARYTGTVRKTMGRLKIVLRNPGFASLLIVFSLTVTPLMAFIAASSYIYIDGFGLNQQHYSYYFAANGLFAMAGPIFYIMLAGRVTRKWIINGSFLIIVLSGFLICFLGHVAPWLLAVSIIPATTCICMLRPPGTNLMFEQQQHDTGSVASLMGCIGLLAGSLGMLIISYGWDDVIMVLGVLHILTGLVCGALWLMISGKEFMKRIPEVSKMS